MYSLAKKIMFSMSPESAHNFAFRWGERIQNNSILFSMFKSNFPEHVWEPKEVFGLSFPNSIGLAAGFDKNAKIPALLESLGFGFIEIGTVTPLGQLGNPKPRLFRDVESHGILNRMGFNNEGSDKIKARLEQARTKFDIKIPVGVNIGKNKETSEEDALDDYIKCAKSLKEQGDYFVVNVSSPNTPGLRNLQNAEFLKKTAIKLKSILNKPLLVKLAADLEDDFLVDLLASLNESQFDGLILCNTSIDKSLAPWSEKLGTGGLSGKLLRMRSREMLVLARTHFKKPIISVGGIDSSDEVKWRLEKGADLVQVYSELIFSGPHFIQKMIKELKEQN